MKKTIPILMFFLLLGMAVAVYADPTPSIPPELSHLLSSRMQLNPTLSDQTKKVIQAKKLPLKGKQPRENPLSNFYVFTSDADYAQVKTYLNGQGIVLREIRLEQASAGSNQQEVRKVAVGRFQNWKVSVTSHLFDPQTKSWSRRTRIIFSR